MLNKVSTYTIELDGNTAELLKGYCAFRKITHGKAVKAALKYVFRADTEFQQWKTKYERLLSEKRQAKRDRYNERARRQPSANTILYGLRLYLETQFQKQEAVFKAEFPNTGSYWSCTARFDLAVFTGNDAHGYEIKAGHDRMGQDQVWKYTQFFDFMTLVTVPERVQDLRMQIPGTWGIIVAETTVRTQPTELEAEVYSFIEPPADPPIYIDLTFTAIRPALRNRVPATT